jgi:hypothetical protein
MTDRTRNARYSRGFRRSSSAGFPSPPISPPPSLAACRLLRSRKGNGVEGVVNRAARRDEEYGTY